jgi:hypothetical protein
VAITLGDGPDRLTVRLSRFGDFVAALIYDDGDPLTVNAWPVGVDIELRFYATDTTTTAAATWTATITGDRAEWAVDKADVAADVLDDANTVVRLFYLDGATDLEWAKGSVKDTG